MTEYNRPNDGPLSGHAAVGFVVGQRYDDGTAPEWVAIRYEKDTRTGEALVSRTSGRVEFSEDSSVRFTRRTGNGTTELEIDTLLGAHPE